MSKKREKEMGLEGLGQIVEMGQDMRQSHKSSERHVRLEWSI